MIKTFFTAPLLAAAILPLSACGSSSDPAAPISVGPRLVGTLSMADQQRRSEACSQRLEHFRQIGVWANGGARPGVIRSAWDMLSDAEKSDLFDVAACVAAGGQTGEKIITVTESGNGPEIETRRIANDRDFATEARAK